MMAGIMIGTMNIITMPKPLRNVCLMSLKAMSRIFMMISMMRNE